MKLHRVFPFVAPILVFGAGCHNGPTEGVRRITYGPMSVAVEPAPSPDGRLLAFTGSPPSFRDSFGVWLYDFERRTTRPLALGFWGPSWSPDGTRLVVTRSGWLYVVDLSTGAIKSVSDGSPTAGREYAADWSPDGSLIAYDVRADGIYIRPAAGGSARRIATGVSPDWFPDGTALVYDASSTPLEGISPQEIRIADAQGGAWRTLAVPSDVPDYADRGGACGGGAEHAKPAVSPDGARVAFMGWDNDVWVVDTSGNDLRALTDGGLPSGIAPDDGYCVILGGYEPAWAPGGTSILLVRPSAHWPREPRTLSPPLTTWRLWLSDGRLEEIPTFR